MPSKVQRSCNEKASQKQRLSKLATENLPIQAQPQIQLDRLDARALPWQNVLQLQRTIGNQAVGRLLASRGRSQNELNTENRTGLPDNLKAGIETHSGMSMDKVKVHYNSSKPAQLHALAYTQGTDIHIGPGQSQCLPHEAWHVVQQQQGRVRPTIQAKGVGINNDGGLEHEADVMGAKALQTRGADQLAASPNLQASSDASGIVIQRSAIKTAGLELELKGVAAARKMSWSPTEFTGTQFDPREKIIDKGDWWIEVDALSPELVTTYTDKKNTLFSWLKAGNEKLNEIQDAANKRIDPPFKGDIAEYPDKQYIAKPQISFGVDKTGLSDFTKYATAPGIKHAEGYQKDATGSKFERLDDTAWPRMNPDVQKLYYSPTILGGSGLTGTVEGKAFIQELVKAPPEVMGMVMMTVLAVSSVARPDDGLRYYKARFAIMPRVPLSELFDSLEDKHQQAYVKLINDWHNSIVLGNQAQPAKSTDLFPEEFPTADRNYRVGLKDTIESIYTPAKRRDKTIKGGKKKVDLMSSDVVASTENVGASVGAYSLPKNSAGIFEIRSLPYIKIDDPAKVENFYLEVINAYGGMPD